MKKKLLQKFINTKVGELALVIIVAPLLLIGCLAAVAFIWLEDKR